MPFDAAKLAKLQAQAAQSRIGAYTGASVIPNDTDAIIYTLSRCLLFKPHADSPSLFSTFPAHTTALFAIADSIYCLYTRLTTSHTTCSCRTSLLDALAHPGFLPPRILTTCAPCHTCTGGKGTVRRKVVKSTKTSGGQDDRKLQAALKKLNMQPISGVEELNMFYEDGSVLHFSAPKGVFYSFSHRATRPHGL
jgi:hypothetical protein